MTRGAVSTGRSDPVTRPAQAPVTGLGRTAALEHPERWGGVVDLPPALDRQAAGRLASVLGGSTGEDQVAVRSSGVLARRVVRATDRDGRAPVSPARRWSPRGTTIITGGSGTIAPHLARWLAAADAEHVVLVSRSGGDGSLVAELREAGCDAEASACDVTDRDAVLRLLGDLRSAGRTVRTVLHAAAVIELAPLAEASLESFARVMDAKAGGARNLAELLDAECGEDLDALVLFSSTAGMWGTGQHAAYVAANAYLIALAEHRRAQGAPASAISWGIWANDITAGRVDPAQIRRSGLVFMEPRQALSGMQRALDDDDDGHHHRRRGLGALPAGLYLSAPGHAVRRDPRGLPAGGGRGGQHRR